MDYKESVQNELFSVSFYAKRWTSGRTFKHKRYPIQFFYFVYLIKRLFKYLSDYLV